MKSLILNVIIISSLFSSVAFAGNKLFVGGLSWDTPSLEVERLVSGYGVAVSVVVRNVDADGVLYATALVEFENDASVDAAVEALDGMIYNGAPLNAKKKDREIVVVGSKVKEVIRSAGLRSDGDLVQAVSDQVHEMLEQAILRAISNKRGTVRPYDL
jgi:RNA recognition motif-containing protein